MDVIQWVVDHILIHKLTLTIAMCIHNLTSTIAMCINGHTHGIVVIIQVCGKKIKALTA
jgi:hypothetical protein